jgi:succinate-semialdehyde dehydrogenase/glutarate-semialdehyde dehydrogenase
MYISQNPFTSVVHETYKNLTQKKLEQKLNESWHCFLNWKLSTFATRSKLMLRIADLLDERKEYYGQLISQEMGKPIIQSEGEIEKCATVCRYYAENSIDFLKSRRLESSAKMSQVIYQPLGPVLAVMPWNFPFWQVFRFLAPAIMAGNTGLLKHASNVPRCALAIEEVFTDAHAPKGLFTNLFIDHKQVEKVIASDCIKAVTFTGSNYAGSIIASLAGKYTKKTVMELGGSDPFIVFEDADLNDALHHALMSRFLNAGQSCIAAKRFIVQEEIAEEFLNNFQSLIENLNLGNPLDDETFMGPLVNKKAIDEIDRQVQQSIKMGAKCIIGGEVNMHMSSVYMPTILCNVPFDSPAWKEEIFGPVAVFHTFETDDQAISLANDTRFGLGASVWTSDMDRAAYLCKNIQAGTVVVNGMVKSEPGLPFGGIKESGFGRELSDYGIFEFMNVKTISYF